MGNDFTHLRPWVGTSHRSFMLLSRGLFLKMLMAKSSRFYRLIKIFGTQADHYGSLRYDGSNRGAGNETRYSMGQIVSPPITVCQQFFHLISQRQCQHLPLGPWRIPRPRGRSTYLHRPRLDQRTPRDDYGFY